MQNDLSRKPKKKIAFIVEYSAIKGYYPFERTSILAKLLKTEEHVTVFLKNVSDEALEIFTDAQLSPILYDHIDELVKHLKELQPDLIVQDGKDTYVYVETIRPLCKISIRARRSSACITESIWPVFSSFSISP